jgi:hypothetical protein
MSNNTVHLKAMSFEIPGRLEIGEQKKPRPRGPATINRLLREARKAGQPVASVTIAANGNVTATFVGEGKAVGSGLDEFDEWVRKHADPNERH